MNTQYVGSQYYIAEYSKLSYAQLIDLRAQISLEFSQIQVEIAAIDKSFPGFRDLQATYREIRLRLDCAKHVLHQSRLQKCSKPTPNKYVEEYKQLSCQDLRKLYYLVIRPEVEEVRTALAQYYLRKSKGVRDSQEYALLREKMLEAELKKSAAVAALKEKSETQENQEAQKIKIKDQYIEQYKSLGKEELNCVYAELKLKREETKKAILTCDEDKKVEFRQEIETLKSQLTACCYHFKRLADAEQLSKNELKERKFILCLKLLKAIASKANLTAEELRTIIEAQIELHLSSVADGHKEADKSFAERLSKTLIDLV